MLSRQVTPCLPPAGRYSLRGCCGRVAAGAQSRGLLVWATAVMGSRLALGMHWPLDLIVATLISWLLVTVACWLTQRLCGPLSPPGEEAQDIKKRMPEAE